MEENQVINWICVISGLSLADIFISISTLPLSGASMGEWVIIAGITGLYILFGFLFIVILPLKAEEINSYIEKLLEILTIEKNHYESKFEDPEHDLWELSMLISHFEKISRSLKSATFRSDINELKTEFANKINFLKKIEK